MLVEISRDAARLVRTTVGAPKGARAAVQRGTVRNDVCHLRCTPSEASTFRDWLHAEADAKRPTSPAIADMLAQAAVDVSKAIARDEP